MQEIQWQDGVPSLEGLYFVAVQMGPAAGCYDFADWNGGAWEKNVEGDVVAFCDVGSFIQQISIKWPFGSDSDLSGISPLSDESDFEEV